MESLLTYINIHHLTTYFKFLFFISGCYFMVGVLICGVAAAEIFEDAVKHTLHSDFKWWWILKVFAFSLFIAPGYGFYLIIVRMFKILIKKVKRFLLIFFS